jgi:acyl-CoA thioesterase
VVKNVMQALPRDADLDEIRSAFAEDRFATDICGIQIDEAGFGHATCSLKITDRHLNAMGTVMGGAIFTLADFCLAIISNVGETPSASIGSTIEYLARAKGDTLIAVAQTDRSGGRIGFYTIDVHDNTGIHIARVLATVIRRPQSP